MNSDIDQDLFAFLYTIAAGVRTLQARTSSSASSGEAGDSVDQPKRPDVLPDLSRLASVLDLVNEQLDSAESRVLDVGQELAEQAASVEAKRITHEAVRSLLDRLAGVRDAVEQLRSFDYRDGPLHDFLVDQRRTLTRVRKTIDAIDAVSLRAEADRELTLHRLRSGLPSGSSG